MPTQNKRLVKERARKIRKASRGKLTTKDYIQRAIVILIILGILATALILTST